MAYLPLYWKSLKHLAISKKKKKLKEFMSPSLKTSKWRLKCTKISHLHVHLCSNSRLSRGKILFIVPVHLELAVLLCAQRLTIRKASQLVFILTFIQKKFCFIISTTSKRSFVMIYCNKRDRLELLNNTKVAAFLQSWLLTPAVLLISGS